MTTKTSKISGLEKYSDKLGRQILRKKISCQIWLNNQAWLRTVLREPIRKRKAVERREARLAAEIILSDLGLTSVAEVISPTGAVRGFRGTITGSELQRLARHDLVSHIRVDHIRGMKPKRSLKMKSREELFSVILRFTVTTEGLSKREYYFVMLIVKGLNQRSAIKAALSTAKSKVRTSVDHAYRLVSIDEPTVMMVERTGFERVTQNGIEVWTGFRSSKDCIKIDLNEQK